MKAPYTVSPNNVKRFFEKIKEIGVPTKVNKEYLKTIGYKSGNDYALITVSKSLGFLDSSGKPTNRWSEFKDKKKAPAVMANAIRETYANLFETYPDADKKEEQALVDYFVGKCLASTKVANYMKNTFRHLCSFADFGATPESGLESVASSAVAAPSIKEAAQITTATKPVTININIQLQLPATEDATIYDSLFSALKKNLFS